VLSNISKYSKWWESMTKKLVVDYRYEWRPSSKRGSGTIWIKAKGEKSEKPFLFTSKEASQFLIIASMLSGHQPVFLDLKKKVFFTVNSSSNAGV